MSCRVMVSEANCMSLGNDVFLCGSINFAVMTRGIPKWYISISFWFTSSPRRSGVAVRAWLHYFACTNSDLLVSL